MELGLNKMPWYGQMLLFGVLAGMTVYGFEYFYAADARVKLQGKESELAQVRERVARPGDCGAAAAVPGPGGRSGNAPRSAEDAAAGTA
jgi:hypothetical protein